MASRLSLEEKLAAIRAMRNGPPTVTDPMELRRYLGDKSNLVVAAAAELVKERTLNELAGDLETAFDRFLVDPVKNDKLCRAKSPSSRPWTPSSTSSETSSRRQPVTCSSSRAGARRLTPATVTWCRVFALARIGGSDYHSLLVDSLTDSEKDVRMAAAQALGYVGTEAAGLVLRLKARLGDAEADVLSECLSGLMTIGPEENLEFVCEYLDPRAPDQCEAAALALGKTRLPGALKALKACCGRAHQPALREQILLAIAMMRLPGATEFLLELVGSDSEALALAAMSALKFHRYDPRLCERLAIAVKATGSRVLQSRWDRDFQGKT